MTGIVDIETEKDVIVKEFRSTSNLLYVQDNDKDDSQCLLPAVIEDGGLISMSANGKGFTASIEDWIKIAHDSQE